MTSSAGRRTGVGMILVALIAALSPAGPAPATPRDSFSWRPAKGFGPVQVRHSLYSVRSAPLRKLTSRPIRSVAELGTPLRAERHSLNGGFSALAAPFPDNDFDGIAGNGQGTPPDPTGEAGPNHYVQATNNGFGIWTKDGTPVVGRTDISALWTGVGDKCETSGKGDPIIQYDQLAQRWLITQFAFDNVNGQKVGPFFECIALSTSPDPLGDYFLYSFNLGSTVFPDFPKFGVWPDAYYMTAHEFDPPTGQYQRLLVLAFDREAMLAGAAASDIGLQAIESQAPEFFGMLPTDLDGTIPPPTGSPNYLVSLSDASDTVNLFRYFIDWVDASGTRVDQAPLQLPSTLWSGNLCNFSRDCIPQGGTAQRLDAFGGESVMYRAAYRNLGTHEALVLNHTIDVNGADLAGVRWYEVRGLATGPFLAQHGTVAGDATHRWMGSIAMDRSGNIALGYSGSSANDFPSVRYIGRLASDPPGVMAQSEVVLTGQGSQTGSNRWGDYTHMSVDPDDDCRFWYTNEYYLTTSAASWRTAIISFRFPQCDPSLPPPPDQTAPKIRNAGDGPDPFTPLGIRRRKTTISWRLNEEATVDVGIFKANGNLVKAIVTRRVLGAGDWFAKWNGKNLNGRIKPGTYDYVIIARDATGNVRR
ncbi:MAG: hypothetical protein ACRDJI_07405, partial [Actinomycetota bacterium]